MAYSRRTCHSTGRVTEGRCAGLESGVSARRRRNRGPAKAEILARGKDTTRLRLTLREGRKREVKRMCAEIGHEVAKLRRTHFAGIETGSLRPGQWRWLRRDEVARLRRLVKLS